MKKRCCIIKTIAYLMFCVCLSVFTAACGKESEMPFTSQIYALDTVIDITAYGESSKEAVSAATKEIYRLEKLLSVTNEASDIYRLNAANGKELELDSETYSLLNISKDMTSKTKGNFDITVYPVLKLWGFTEDKHTVPADSQIHQALNNVGAENIVLSENNTVKLADNAQVDLGGIAKGYIADKAAQTMKEAGCNSGLISLGGNVRTIGCKTTGENWSIGIQHPQNNSYFATISTGECSVITSGAYQRNFTQNGVTYHHIIDPKTGKPSDSDAESVTIIGADGAMCDALSTAIFIGGSEYAEALSKSITDFEYIVLTKDNKLYISASLKGNLTLSESCSHIQIIYK